MLRITLFALTLATVPLSAVSDPGDRMPSGANPAATTPGMLDQNSYRQEREQDERAKKAAIAKAENRIQKLERRYDQSGLDKPYSLQSELGLMRGDIRTLSLTPVERWRDVDQRITQKLDNLEQRYQAE